MNKLVELYEYVSSRMTGTTLKNFDIPVKPERVPSKLKEELEALFNGDVKEMILRDAKKWFEKNPSRRNVKSTSRWNITLYLLNNSDKTLIDVSKELDRIGVIGPCTWWSMIGKDGLGGNVSCGQGTIDFSTPTAKQFKDGNYKYSCSDIYVNNFTFTPSQSGNGYNNLPATDMTVIRKKFWECMDGVTCNINYFPNEHSERPTIYNFNVILVAKYDKGKLRSLLKELQEDRRLQNFAEVNDSIGRGIARYYASKKSGDYTGD